MDTPPSRSDQPQATAAGGFELRAWCVVLGQGDVKHVEWVPRRADAEAVVAALVERVRRTGAMPLRYGWVWTDEGSVGGWRSCGSVPRP